MNLKKTALSLLGVLFALIIQQRDRIWYELKPLPAWWKILIAVLFSLFFTGALIFSFGVMPEFLSFFNITFQQ